MILGENCPLSSSIQRMVSFLLVVRVQVVQVRILLHGSANLSAHSVCLSLDLTIATGWRKAVKLALRPKARPQALAISSSFFKESSQAEKFTEKLHLWSVVKAKACCSEKDTIT